MTYTDVELNADSKIIQREKIQASSLAKECYSMKLDLLTNATVVEDAIRFVGERTKEHENKQDMIGNELEPTTTNQIF